MKNIGKLPEMSNAVVEAINDINRMILRNCWMTPGVIKTM
jgi:hypothetical protein